MKKSRERKIQRTFHKLHKPKNGTTYRNAINQTAHLTRTSERKVHAALLATHRTPA